MSLQHKIEPGVERVASQLVESGFETYVVGGAVRDLLLGIPPKDYDLATAATPEQVRQVFGRRKARIIGRRFRLAHVYTERGYYEVSTFRREPTAEERRGRVNDDGVMLWRDNEYGTLEEDARRRDFTANAIFYDPVGNRGIIDLVGGVQDIRDGVVRTIGEPGKRLDEDPVRLLRAVKLVAQYGFKAEPELDRCLRERVEQICRASSARLFEELLKIFSRPFANRTFTVFHEYGLLRHFWPNLAEIWGTPRGWLTAALLAERDRRMAVGGYSNSRALALSTVVFPAVAVALGCEDDPSRFWEPGEEVDAECREAIRRFFQPFTVSRFFTARVRDILLLLPRFRDPTCKGRLLRHPEYKYGRELFALLATVYQWGDECLAEWPQHNPALHGSPPHRRDRRFSHERGRGRDHDQGRGQQHRREPPPEAGPER